LDGHNETYILDLIRNKSEDLTILMIAHRLSTVRDADMIVYLSHGRVIRAGSFDYVRETTPEFDNQLKNMGL
jgi:ABC-type multidrug transport system fused ATPase/permease subunit